MNILPVVQNPVKKPVDIITKSFTPLPPVSNGGTVREQLLNLSPALALVPANGDKTYSSDALVSSIVDDAGVTWSADATKEPTYDEPSLVGLDNTTNIRASFSASGDLTIVMYFYVPPTVAANILVMSLGSSSALGNANASLNVNTNGTISYARNLAAGFETLSATDRRGTYNLLTLKYTEGGNCEAYLNENDVVTFSPNAGYATATYLHLFSRQPSFQSIADMEFGDVFLFPDVVDLPSQSEMLSFYQGIYG